VFPTPAQLAAADLSGVGLPARRAAALRTLAQAAATGALDWQAEPEHVARALGAVPGVDDGAVQYVGLRALGEPDAFPASDLILRRLAGGPRFLLSVRAMQQRARSWRPWRGYAAIHLWRAAAEQGAIGRRGIGAHRAAGR
jgi:AraC family transcriptional regulator of adaptative response / DNA-3-methyladenine glycosylase II